MSKKKPPIKATPKPTVAQKPVNLTQIIQLANDRGYKDIGDWKNALMQAEFPQNPRRNALLNIYEQLILDGHMRMIRKQLHLHVTSGVVQVINDKNQVDEDLTKLFSKLWFQDFAKHAIDAILFGHSLMQLAEANPITNTVKMVLIPRKNVVPETGGWLKNEWDLAANSINYRNDPTAMNWLIEVGNTNDLGELNPAAPYILFKKNAMQCWSEFCERFGMPLAKAKVNARDLNAVNRMENFLVNMGSSSYAIIDQSEEIEFIESAKADAFNVYDKLIERCNSELSKMILMQVMANDVGANGSRAQAQVHDLRGDEVRSSLRSWIMSLVNEILLPILKVHGFDTEGKTAKYFSVNRVDKDTFEQDKWLDDIFDIPFEHFAEKYSTPIIGKKTKELPPQVPGLDPLKAAKEKKAVKNVADFINSPVNSILQMHQEIKELYHHNHNHE